MLQFVINFANKANDEIHSRNTISGLDFFAKKSVVLAQAVNTIWLQRLLALYHEALEACLQGGKYVTGMQTWLSLCSINSMRVLGSNEMKDVLGHGALL